MSSAADEMKSWVEKRCREDGYYPCPDESLYEDLLQGLATNTSRYGYRACPCRIASGSKTYDGDIICPCEYRDADIEEFGMCYCGLFVNETIKDNPSKIAPIPERRPIENQDAAMQQAEQNQQNQSEPSTPESDEKNIKVYRCKVCGYLAARENPPPVCPICKAKAKRFEEFSLK